MKLIFALALYFSTYQLIFAQQYKLSGKVIETFSKVPLPFAHIVINGSNHLFADIDGGFKYTSDEKVNKIECRYNMHRPYMNINPTSDTLTIKMNRFGFFQDELSTSSRASSIIKDVLLWTTHNNPDLYTYYSYSTYNKFTVTPGNIEDANKMIKSLSGIIPGTFRQLYPDQHLLLVESSSEKQYLNENNHKEIFNSTKASGVSVPSVFYKTSQLQASNIYKDYILFNGREYLSPLCYNSLENYNFALIDSATVDKRNVFVLKFNPKPEKNFDGLRGQLCIDEKFNAVRHYSISPMDDHSASSTIYQEFQLIDDLKWFPKESKTENLTYKGLYEVKYSSKLSSRIFNIKRNIPLSRTKFDEVVLDLPTTALENSDFERSDWATLSKADSNTYDYYETVDRKHHIQKFLYLGERLYHGYIPLGFLDVDLDRILTFNEVERARIGIGAHTNNTFSQKVKLGFFIGYGLKDEKVKYGIDWSYRMPNLLFGEYRGYISHELQESGTPLFMFDRYQYATESLRRFRLKILDMVTETGQGFYLHPANNLDMGAEVNFSVHEPTYTYSFKGQEKNFYRFIEMREGLRYAIREKYYKIEDRTFSLGTSYPILYLQLTQSLGGMIGNYPYRKIDFKLEENLKILRLGISKIQLVAGLTRGNAPYMKLYNEKGSRKGTYFLIHNSFETMGYNEFLSDRYYSIFYTHSFGRIYYGHPNIQPSISMMHNAGVGWLDSSHDHQKLPFAFKSMEKGYFESGAMVENILVLNLAGAKSGFGIGFYYRYGPYSSLKGSENVVIKFALNFGI